MAPMIETSAPPLRVDETGTIRVGSSRVTLDIVIGGYHLGWSPEQIAHAYSTVTLAEVYATIGYYLTHREELDSYLQVRQREAEELKRKIESEPGYQEMKDKLLARARERGLR
jgi:uncharacterized protein (DUF433 family)